MTITEHAPVVRAEAAPVSPWRRWLGPAGFAFFGLVDIGVFALFAHKGDASFAFSQPFADQYRGAGGPDHPDRPALQ